MAIPPQTTSFTLDHQGRYLANTLDEALHSAGVDVYGGNPRPRPDARPFDVVVVGGGSFGVIFAQHLLATDTTRSRRVLILERGPYVIPEHEQNLPYVGGVAPGFAERWVSDLDTGGTFSSNRRGGFSGLQEAVGGRSLKWGGWSPELLDDELRDWPAAVAGDLRATYFEEASDQLGTTDTNDYLFGPLHTALRQSLLTHTSSLANTQPLAAWPDHPRVRYKEPAATDARLRELLGLTPADPVLPRQRMLDLLKLEAPLAVQARSEPGQFPTNKFSSVPLLIRAVRQDVHASGGQDELRRLMVVPNVQVLDFETTPPGASVRATAVRVDSPVNGGRIPLAANGLVVVANGTVEATRLAKLTYQQSLAGGVWPEIGANLMAHLRSNLNLRLPLASLGLTAADLQSRPLPVSALFLKGRAVVRGQNRYFHLQITASAGGAGAQGSEALLFQKVPDLDSLEALQQATPTHVVVTLRGIGEMVPGNPSSTVGLAGNDADGGRPAAWVTLGNAREYAADPTRDPLQYQLTPVSQATRDDADVWAAMDDWTDAVAVGLAAGQSFQVLAGTGVRPIPAGTTAAQFKALVPHTTRRDKLGTTHHEAGTLRIGVVTDDLGRLEGTPNCYFAGPCLFPTIGSPNPMLTGTALARRTADYLHGRSPVSTPRPNAPQFPAPAPPPVDGPGWQVLFDGTDTSLGRWRRVRKAGAGDTDCNLHLIDGQLATTGSGDHALLYYAASGFTNFVLRLQFRVVDAANHNGGVFVRIRQPELDLPPMLAGRADADPFGRQWRQNRAWTAVYSGFEVQIDDNDPAPNRRTGTVYDIPVSTTPAPNTQTLTAGPAVGGGGWFEYEITVVNNDYEVKLGTADGSPKTTVSQFTNADSVRGVSSSVDPAGGHIGLQAHNNGRVYYRHVRIKPL